MFLIPVCLAASNCTNWNFSSRIKNRSVLLNPVATVFPVTRRCVNWLVPCFLKNPKKLTLYFSDMYISLLLRNRSGYTSLNNPSWQCLICYTNCTSNVKVVCWSEAAWPIPCTIYMWRIPSCVVQYSMRICVPLWNPLAIISAFYNPLHVPMTSVMLF